MIVTLSKPLDIPRLHGTQFATGLRNKQHMDHNKQNTGKDSGQTDPNRQSASRDKSSNVNKTGRTADDNSDADSSKLYLTDDSTLQTREEKEKDNRVDPRQDRTISVSEDDLHAPELGRLTGRDDDDDQRNQ